MLLASYFFLNIQPYASPYKKCSMHKINIKNCTYYKRKMKIVYNSLFIIKKNLKRKLPQWIFENEIINQIIHHNWRFITFAIIFFRHSSKHVFKSLFIGQQRFESSQNIRFVREILTGQIRCWWGSHNHRRKICYYWQIFHQSISPSMGNFLKIILIMLIIGFDVYNQILKNQKKEFRICI